MVMVQVSAQDGVPQQLPSTLVHLKYLCIEDNPTLYGLPDTVNLLKDTRADLSLNLLPQFHFSQDEEFEEAEVKPIKRILLD
ncbi:hypothetical protein Tco_0037136 [Tanacetum coccineum]